MSSLVSENLTFEYRCVYTGIPGPEHDPDDYPMTWEVTVRTQVPWDDAEAADDEVLVGRAVLCIVTDFVDIDLVDTLDAISQEMHNLAVMLTYERADLLTSLNPDLMYLQSVEVQPEFRGHRVGHAIVEAILTTLGRSVGPVLATPAPVLTNNEGEWLEGIPEEGTAEHTVIQQALKRYWMDFGFVEATPMYLFLDATELYGSLR